ncbi:MAG: hypothetical protein A3B11_02415 [Candidatus Taylorbacteria bacterium RIFCSPLOWO2_01_FULL_44_26]|uniref:Uncharacterized protein n=1 Tax=Candidatus Taylorbacteria bacterium RIFCSPLOWO2_01_FULL_44_26 TaxID=1802318 RepID=A0A1G2N6G4_9BACT|nr:MAG: hypothetical protein A3B11_02415 [Candidatus Taylorbacteria bacterium RIFCSPLOWO2_01_FULL_44_26]
MLKNKRVVLVALAVVLLALLFFIKTKSEWQNEEVAGAGLVSGDEILGDVLSKDTDKDGILDWEEGLWGTDPTKKDTNDDGVSDKEEIARMKVERGATSGELASADGSGEASEENLTQTDKFARELFSTVAALNQTGEIDDNTVAQITDSLASQIQNPVQRKVFVLADLKVTEDSSQASLETYANAVVGLYQRYPINGNVIDILNQLSETEDNTELLSELSPTVEQIKNFVNGMIKINVPMALTESHLEVINSLQVIMENLEDLQLFDADPIIALGALSQYEKNTDQFASAIDKLSAIYHQSL